MKRMIVAVAVLMLGAVFTNASAQAKKEQAKASVKGHAMTGYLVDKMCSKRFLGDAGKAKAAKHTKECATEESCAASGYGLIFDGKFFKFDDAGDKKAAEFLKSTKKERDLFVEVHGSMDGEKMAVTAIAEAKERK